VVMQERLFFRNIPLSNWIEREMVIEEGMDLDQLPKESVFATAPLEASPFPAMVETAPAVPAMTPQIAQTEDLMVLSSFIETSNHRNGREANGFVQTAVPAFGAQ
jgi:hypothetical protein